MSEKNVEIIRSAYAGLAERGLEASEGVRRYFASFGDDGHVPRAGTGDRSRRAAGVTAGA
jgi:hypothetical protein